MPDFKIANVATHQGGKTYGTGTGYNGCMGKVHWIFEHTGVLLSFQEVTALCEMWKSESGNPDGWTQESTWSKLREYESGGSEGIDKLKAELARMRKKMRFKILSNYMSQEHITIPT